jgi:predicted polyphosphate/ATP-dependent NAD kinase
MKEPQKSPTSSCYDDGPPSAPANVCAADTCLGNTLPTTSKMSSGTGCTPSSAATLSMWVWRTAATVFDIGAEVDRRSALNSPQRGSVLSNAAQAVVTVATPLLAYSTDEFTLRD